jgi:hypothetical protein
MQLVDYKVRVINSGAGTAARVRVAIEPRQPRHLGHGGREREHHRGQLDGGGQRGVQDHQGPRVCGKTRALAS